MMRNIYFEGELGDKFIPHMHMKAENVAEAFQCLNANFPEFKKYILEKCEENVGFHIDVAGNELEDPREILLELKRGDITVTPIPAGAKSGPAKILAAIALTVATAGIGAYVAGAATAGAAGGMAAVGATFSSFSAFAGTLGALAGAGGMMGIATTMALGMATNLALSGITQMMAPDPATDGDQEQSYLFNGAEQNIIEGDPVPVLYGRLRVPGQPVSFEIAGASATYGSTGTLVPGRGQGDGWSGHSWSPLYKQV